MIYPIIIYNVFEYFLKILSAPHDVLTVEKVQHVESQVVAVLGALQMIFLLITFLLSIFLSHRIAGPLYKLRRAIEEVSRGNFDQRISFRKNDHFTELQDSFNDMVQHLGVRRWKD